MTLVAVASDLELWKSLEEQWLFILADRGNAPYCHMREIMSLRGVFEAWTPARRDILLEGLVDLLGQFTHDPRSGVFSCTVDLEAHDRWKQKMRHPCAARLCARSVIEAVISWRSERNPKDPIEAFFDQNERFIHHIRSELNRKNVRGQEPLWKLVRSLTEANMRRCPPLQLVDMVAWARNRLAVPPSNLGPVALKPHISVRDQDFSRFAAKIFRVSPGSHYVADEFVLSTHRFH